MSDQEPEPVAPSLKHVRDRCSAALSFGQCILPSGHAPLFGSLPHIMEDGNLFNTGEAEVKPVPRFTDEVTFAALRGYDKRSGYSKLERMRDALEVAAPLLAPQPVVDAQVGYEAVYEVIRGKRPGVPATEIEVNALIWSGVHAFINAMGIDPKPQIHLSDGSWS